MINLEEFKEKQKNFGYTKGYSSVLKIDKPLSKIQLHTRNSKVDFNVNEKPKRIFRETILTDTKNMLKDMFLLPSAYYVQNYMLPTITIIKGELDTLVKLMSTKAYVTDIPCSFKIKEIESAVMCIDIDQHIFSKIYLPKNATSIIKPMYTHEIFHILTLLDKDTIGDFQNSEFLSIFMEFITAYYDSNPQVFEAIKNFRLADLNEKISYIEKYNNIFHGKQNLVLVGLYSEESIEQLKIELIQDSAYVVSTIKAIELFMKYVKGNSVKQKEILCYIQSVISGLNTVEDIIEELDINMDKKDKNILSFQNFKK